jgi:hypothetical protein
MDEREDNPTENDGFDAITSDAAKAVGDELDVADRILKESTITAAEFISDFIRVGRSRNNEKDTAQESVSLTKDRVRVAMWLIAFEFSATGKSEGAVGFEKLLKDSAKALAASGSRRRGNEEDDEFDGDFGE